MTRRPATTKTGRPEVDEAILDLLKVAGLADADSHIGQLIANAVLIGMDGNSRGDVKLLGTALRDLRQALNSFRPYQDRPKCSIFGSARTPAGSPAHDAAVAIGAALVENGWMVITGGGPGIMTAGIEGAGRENAFGVTIRLPFEPMDAGGIVSDEHLVRFRHFFTRKLMFMKESSAYVVFPGGFGTHDETFELLTLMQTGKEPPAPVVLFEPAGDQYWYSWRSFVTHELVGAGLVSVEDLDLFMVTSSVDEAMAYIADFYRVFHSLRYVNDHLVIRLQHDISDDRLAALNDDFSDILASGVIERATASESEIHDDDEVDRARLQLAFDKRHFGRLHQLIRAL